jgi:hypothetical protein
MLGFNLGHVTTTTTNSLFRQLPIHTKYALECEEYKIIGEAQLKE